MLWPCKQRRAGCSLSYLLRLLRRRIGGAAGYRLYSGAMPHHAEAHCRSREFVAGEASGYQGNNDRASNIISWAYSSESKFRCKHRNRHLPCPKFLPSRPSSYTLQISYPKGRSYTRTPRFTSCKISYPTHAPRSSRRLKLAPLSRR